MNITFDSICDLLPTSKSLSFPFILLLLSCIVCFLLCMFHVIIHIKRIFSPFYIDNYLYKHLIPISVVHVFVLFEYDDTNNYSLLSFKTDREAKEKTLIFRSNLTYVWDNFWNGNSTQMKCNLYTFIITLIHGH